MEKKRTKLTEAEMGDDIVKSLLESGFDESTIAGWIDEGTIQKSEPSEEEDPDEVDPEKKGKGSDEEEDDEDLEKGNGDEEDTEEEEDDEDIEKGNGDDEDPEEEEDDEDIEKGKGCHGKGKKTPDIVKAIASDVFRRTKREMQRKEEKRNEAMEQAIEKAVNAVADRFEKSLDGMRKAIIAFGDAAPKFKSAGLNRAVLEKSMGGGAKDENNKTVLSVSRDRGVVRELLEKAIAEEKDEAIQKSLRDDVNAYMIDPLYGQVGETAARYMYDNKNVRLVK